MTEEEKIDGVVKSIAATAVDWPDEELARRIVGLLIEDGGVVNAWQRTIESMIKIIREREKLLTQREQGDVGL